MMLVKKNSFIFPPKAGFLFLDFVRKPRK